ncbi:MAG TPA: ferredoxin [Candidatus Hypogeohydataceae bacterium YC38]
MRISRRRFLVYVGVSSICLFVPCVWWWGALAEGRLRVVVHREKCNGCATCVDICPEVFAMEKERAVVKLDPIPPELEVCAMGARDECMAGAIKIVAV